MFYSGVMVLVVSNPPCTMCSVDLKLLARLLPELYSTQSSYHYLSEKEILWSNHRISQLGTSNVVFFSGGLDLQVNN